MKFLGFFLTIFFVFSVSAQQLNRDFELKSGGIIEVVNLYGRVSVTAEETQNDKVSVTAQAQKSLAEGDVKTAVANGKVTVQVNPQNSKVRIDLIVKVPLRSRVRVETGEGEVRVAGNLASAEVATGTGTISTDVPLENLKYSFVWTQSRPRYLSDAELAEVREKAAGRFVLNGALIETDESKKAKGKTPTEETGDAEDSAANDETTTKDADQNPKTADKKNTKDRKNKKKKTKNQKPKTKDQSVELNFTTARGIILLNINPAEVPSNLQERPLTEAAKAIIRSGDGLLMSAIRRASPKYFGDYLKTLPPRKREPLLTTKSRIENNTTAQIKRVLVKVTDINNRAVGNLQKKDFTVLENGKEREVLRLEPTTAPFNIVLLLDVSGSIENYVDFIRKAARSFINTTSAKDKIAIVIFNEDVKQISTFTTNRKTLSESLDTFDAGGGTAFYDALAFTLVETLQPLKGERTGVVILSDGDDNRSFLPFESLLSSIQESGALVYPLYVPSGLIADSSGSNANASPDPLRTRYMALTSKAETEGARLAQVSGGVYYPIRRLEELQKAYDDIVVQLRTAYTITFRSDSAETNETRASPRLKVKVNRENSFVNLGSVVDVPPAEAEKLETKKTSENFDYLKEVGEPQKPAKYRRPPGSLPSHARLS